MPGFIHIAAPVLEKVFQSTATNAADQSAYTFTSVDFGAADSSRELLVVIAGKFPAISTRTLSSVTIGGVSASVETLISASGQSGLTIALVALPTGTSGDIVVTWGGGSVNNCSIAVYRVTNRTSSGTGSTNVVSAAVSITGSLNLSGINIPSGGFILSTILLDGNITGLSHTGVTVVQDATQAPDGMFYESVSSAIQASSVSSGTLGWSWTNGRSGIAAAWSFSG